MSNIEWTGETWNPILGCSKISAGCRKCYAINQAYRNWEMAKALPENKRGRLAYYEGLTSKNEHGIDWSGKVVFVPEALEIPLKRKKPQTYFVNSMSDMFHDEVDSDWIDAIWDVMERTPQHTYQILTKRPENMKSRLKGTEPLPNVWLGVSVENQKAADERIPLLLDTPAAVRFLSCEPLLEKVDLTKCGDADYSINALNGQESYGISRRKGIYPGIDWVIVGGESGGNSRPCNVDWLEEIVDQCLAGDVSIFVKQMGANPIGLETKLTDKKGGILEEFPESLQYRQMPTKTN